MDFTRDRKATMALTRDFKETIRARAERDPRFRKELLREGVEIRDAVIRVMKEV